MANDFEVGIDFSDSNVDGERSEKQFDIEWVNGLKLLKLLQCRVKNL